MKYQTIFAVAALAALTACGSKPQSDQNDVETPVSVQELRKGSISKLIHTTGTAQAAGAAELVSKMPGPLRRRALHPRGWSPGRVPRAEEQRRCRFFRVRPEAIFRKLSHIR